MTPAQLSALSDVHRRVNAPAKRGRERDTATPGTAADLLSLQSMRRV